MQRALRIKRNERYRQRVENLFYREVLKLLKDYSSSFTYDLQKHGLGYVQSRLAATTFGDKLGGVLLKLYKVTGSAKAEQIFGELMKVPVKLKRFGYNQAWVDQITQYFNDHLYDKVVRPIDANTRRLFAAKIDEMTRNGYGHEWLVNQVKSPTFLAYRARMIARTESNRAINFGAYIAAKNCGYKVEKVWVAVHDNRTRHSHLKLDKLVVPFDQPFKPLLKYPCDPDAPGNETINCRCHVEYRPLRDSLGNLIIDGQVPVLTDVQRREVESLLRYIRNNRAKPLTVGPRGVDMTKPPVNRKPNRVTPTIIPRNPQTVAPVVPVVTQTPKDPYEGKPLPSTWTKEQVLNEIQKHFSGRLIGVDIVEVDVLRGVEWALRERKTKTKFTNMVFEGYSKDSAIMSAQLWSNGNTHLNLYNDALERNMAESIQDAINTGSNWTTADSLMKNIPIDERITFFAKAITEHELGHLNWFKLKVELNNFFKISGRELRQKLWKHKAKWEAFASKKLREYNSSDINNKLKWYPSEYSIYKKTEDFFLNEWMAEGVVMLKYRRSDIKDAEFLKLLEEFEQLVSNL